MRTRSGSGSLAAAVCACWLLVGGCRGDRAGPVPAAAADPPAVVASEDAAAPPPPPFAVTELAPDVLVATTEPFAANTLLVRTAEGAVILVDTPTTPADTDAVLDWIEARWSAAPRYAIASHWHPDASGGNQALVARGVEVISTAQTAALVESRGAAIRDELIEMFAARDPDTARELEAIRPTPASRRLDVDETAELRLGGELVQLIYPGPSHSDDSIGIFFPDRKLLYGGCTVRSDGRIINRSEADADNWPRALEAFAALEPTLVIPGHGRRFDPAMLPESMEAAKALATPPARR